MKHKRLLIAVLTLFIQLSLTAQTEIKTQAVIGGAKGTDNLVQHGFNERRKYYYCREF